MAEMRVSSDEMARDLHARAGEQLRGREERWKFQRHQGIIPDELIVAAVRIRDASLAIT